jgi:hypothetical protein
MFIIRPKKCQNHEMKTDVPCRLLSIFGSMARHWRKSTDILLQSPFLLLHGACSGVMSRITSEGETDGRGRIPSFD